MHILKRSIILLGVALFLQPSFAYADNAEKKAKFVEGDVLIELSDETTLELLGHEDLEKALYEGDLFSSRRGASLNRIINKDVIESIEPVFESRFDEAKKLYSKDKDLESLKEIEAIIINDQRSKRNKPAIKAEEMLPLSNSFKIQLQERYHPYTEIVVEYLNMYPSVNSADLNYILRASLAPTNDSNTNYGQQWGLKNDGTFVNDAVAGADIAAEGAWDKTTGSSETIIAILDSGVAPHPEYEDRLLTGDNFATGGAGGGNIDSAGHGTEIAGIAAASGSDGFGIAGVCWDCKILPVRVLSPVYANPNDPNSAIVDVEGDLADIAVGITYASEWLMSEGGNGATVINLSVQSEGYPGPTTVNKAITNAEKYYDVLVVSTRGNYENGYSTPTERSFPGYHSKTLSVGALNPCNERKDKSTACEGNATWGSRYETPGSTASNAEGRLDFLAPGAEILTTKMDGSGYTTTRGVSFAAPHVAGIVGLMLSMDASLTPTEIRQILRDSSVDIGAAGWDNETGYGRVSAEAALNMLCEQKPGLADCIIEEPEPELDNLNIQSSGPSEAQINESVNYSVVVANDGLGMAEDVEFRFFHPLLDHSLESIIINGGVGDCNELYDGVQTVCMLDDLAASEQHNISITIKALEKGTFASAFLVRSASMEVGTFKNTMSLTKALILEESSVADLEISYTEDQGSSDNPIYVANIMNHGPETANNLELTFQSGFKFSLQSVFADGVNITSSCASTNTVVECELGDLDNAESKELEIHLLPAEEKTAVSEFSITSLSKDLNLENNSVEVNVSSTMAAAAPSISATTGNENGFGSIHIQWAEMDGLGENFDRYLIRFAPGIIDSFNGIKHGRSYLNWNYYKLSNFEPGTSFTFQMQAVKDSNPSLPIQDADKWIDVGLRSNFVHCTIPETENELTCEVSSAY